MANRTRGARGEGSFLTVKCDTLYYEASEAKALQKELREHDDYKGVGFAWIRPGDFGAGTGKGGEPWGKGLNETLGLGSLNCILEYPQADPQDPRNPKKYKEFLIHYTPETGTWAGGTYTLRFEVPADWPKNPLRGFCDTPIWHPNIGYGREPNRNGNWSEPGDGWLCHSSLKLAGGARSNGSHTATANITTILQGLFTLFTGTVGSELIDFGDAQNPKAREEYYQNKDAFFRTAENYKRKYAMGRNVTPPAHCLPQIYRFPNKIPPTPNGPFTNNLQKLAGLVLELDDYDGPLKQINMYVPEPDRIERWATLKLLDVVADAPYVGELTPENTVVVQCETAEGEMVETVVVNYSIHVAYSNVIMASQVALPALVEAQFEADGVWTCSTGGEATIADEKRFYFETYKDLVSMDEPDCLKSLRGMLQDGPITDLYSGGGGGEIEAKFDGPKPHEGFALRMPAEEIKDWIFEDEKGFMRPTPRPATALRVWVPAPRTGAYKTIETRLDGVPKYISGVKDWYRDLIRKLNNSNYIGRDLVAQLVRSDGRLTGGHTLDACTDRPIDGSFRGDVDNQWTKLAIEVCEESCKEEAWAEAKKTGALEEVRVCSYDQWGKLIFPTSNRQNYTHAEFTQWGQYYPAADLEWYWDNADKTDEDSWRWSNPKTFVFTKVPTSDTTWRGEFKEAGAGAEGEQ